MGHVVGAALVTGAAGDLTDNIPVAALLLVPLALLLALIVAYVLGPVGEPADSQRREGGVSRALARQAGTRPPADT